MTKWIGTDIKRVENSSTSVVGIFWDIKDCTRQSKRGFSLFITNWQKFCNYVMEVAAHIQSHRRPKRDKGKIFVYGKSNKDTCSDDKSGTEIGKC